MRLLLVLLCVAATLVPAVGHGLWTGRWGDRAELQAFADRLGKVSFDLRDWQGEEVRVEPRAIAKAELTGYLSRKYTHRASRHSVMVFVACGRPGPVCVHTPDVCYEGLGYALQASAAPMNVPFDGLSADFLGGTFVKSDATKSDSLQIYWSWNATGTWSIPRFPRMHFGGQPALYKLYVIHRFSQDADRKEAEEICKGFMSVFLPELQRALFDAPSVVLTVRCPNPVHGEV